MPVSIVKKTQQYWEEALRKAGLAMSIGQDDHLIYAGDATDLSGLDGETLEINHRRSKNRYTSTRLASNRSRQRGARFLGKQKQI